MLDYRIHYAQLVAEDRLRNARVRELTRPATRIHRRESERLTSPSTRR